MFEIDSPPNYRFTLTSANGSVLKTVDTGAGSGSVWQGDSAALLLYGPNKTFAVLATDGTVVGLPSSLNAAFDMSTADAIGTNAGDPILLSSTVLLGSSGYANAKYELVDLQSGNVTVLLTADTTEPPGNGIRPPTALPLGTSRDRRTARVVVRHCVANGTAVPGLAMVEIDLSNKVVTTIRSLPLPSGLDPFDIGELAVSPDGRFLAYQENSRADSNNMAITTTHIVDLASGRDMPLGDTSIASIGNSRGLRFSPDGTVLLVYGTSSLQVSPQHSRLGTFATSDGHSLQSFDVGDTLHNMVQPVGWLGDHTLIYTVTTTNVLGNFTNGEEAAHALDVASGARNDLPVGLGRLVAVLT